MTRTSQLSVSGTSLPTRLSALSTKPPCVCPGSINERRQDSSVATSRDEGRRRHLPRRRLFLGHSSILGKRTDALGHQQRTAPYRFTGRHSQQAHCLRKSMSCAACAPSHDRHRLRCDFPVPFAVADPSSSGLIGAGGRPPCGCGASTYVKSGCSFHGPRTSSPCDRLKTSFTVSSGGILPNIGSVSLPIASSAFMNILACVISRVRRCVRVFLVPSSSHALMSASYVWRAPASEEMFARRSRTTLPPSWIYAAVQQLPRLSRKCGPPPFSLNNGAS